MTWTFIVTWYNVTYYADTNDQFQKDRKRNFFQAILTTDEAFSYAIYYYNQMLWTTGDASGGTDGLGGMKRKGITCEKMVFFYYIWSKKGGWGDDFRDGWLLNFLAFSVIGWGEWHSFCSCMPKITFFDPKDDIL